MSKRILIIGMSGQGKSTYVKKQIGMHPQLVYDVQNEYNHLPFDVSKSIARVSPLTMGFKDFAALVEKTRKKIIVFEEATVFLKGQVGQKVRGIMVGARHTRNNIFMIFHSIQTVPPDVFLITDIVVLFKTNDNPDIVRKKYPVLMDSFSALQRAPKFSHKIIKLI